MKNKKVNYIIIGICLVIMLVTLFLTDSPENLWNALCTANPLWLLCGLGCMLAYWLLETRALFLVIDGLRKVSQSNGRRLKPTECLRVSMVGQLFNCITPFASGGQPMQAYMLSKYGQSVGTASSALLARFIVYQFVLTVYSVVVLVFKFTFFLEQVSGFVIPDCHRLFPKAHHQAAAGSARLPPQNPPLPPSRPAPPADYQGAGQFLH